MIANPFARGRKKRNTNTLGVHHAQPCSEVQTNLTDSSGEQALKIGLYGSADRSPEWFYVGQGNFVLGTVDRTVLMTRGGDGLVRFFVDAIFMIKYERNSGNLQDSA